VFSQATRHDFLLPSKISILLLLGLAHAVERVKLQLRFAFMAIHVGRAQHSHVLEAVLQLVFRCTAPN